jgi:glycosyltransferase involved in cell wall biosynthesis
VVLLPYQDVGLNHRMCSPSKLFHYIMAGVPIVASDLPFLNQVITNGGLGYCCDTSNPETLALNIRRCLEHQETLKRNLSVANKVYCWENEERKLLKVYENLTRPH